MAQRIAELRAKMSLESQARSAATAEGMRVEIELQALRKRRNSAKVALEQVASVQQTSVSEPERCEDIYISTLREYIKALGGELRLVASFPEGDIRVHPF